MANTVSIQLHQLIKSLSASEKRYFRIFAKRHQAGEKTSYIELFELIDAQEVYDEERVKEKSESISFSKFTSITKNRLYHQILRSLDAYHASRSAADEVNRQIHYAEILYQKALYDQCEKALRTAGKTSVKFEYFAGLLQVAKWKKRLAEVHQFERKNDLSILQIFELEQDALRKLEHSSQLWKHKSELFAQLFTKGQLRNKQEASKMIPEILGQMTQWSGTKPTFESEYLANHTLSALYFGVNDYQNSYRYLKANFKLLDKKIHMALEDPSIYLATITNLVYVTAKLNLLDETAMYLKKSKALPDKLANTLTPDLKIRHDVNSFSLEMAITYLTGDSMQARSLIPEVTKWLKSNGQRLSQVRKASIYTSLANLHFMMQNFKDALKWNNELLNTVSQDKAADQYRFAEMHHILIHFELENKPMVIKAAKRLGKYFENSKQEFRFEKHFIEMITALVANANMDKLALYESFLKSSLTAEKDPYEKSIMEFFDFTAWILAKRNNTSLSSTLKERSHAKDVL